MKPSNSKKQIWAGVALAATISSSHSVYAQSSVTLYGSIDAGLSYVSNSGGHNLYSVTSGNSAGNRWGLKGVEDLGGGLQAVFDLEDGYSVTTGQISQGGTFWGRQAWVGLGSSYGTVTMGRQYAAATLSMSSFSAGSDWAATGARYGTHPGDLDDLDGTNRLNNSVKFVTRNLNGFTGSADYAFGNVAGSSGRNQIISVALNYQYGPFRAGAAYLDAKQPNFSFWGNTLTSSATGINLPSPTLAGYASANAQQITMGGASYTLGSGTFGLFYSNTKFTALNSVTVTGLTATERRYRGDVSFNDFEANFKYRVTPALFLGIAGNYLGSSGAGQGSVAYRQLTAGAIYSLSKRTSVYLMGFYENASGTDSLGQPAAANINGTTASSTKHQAVATVGMRNVF